MFWSMWLNINSISATNQGRIAGDGAGDRRPLLIKLLDFCSERDRITRTHKPVKRRPPDFGENDFLGKVACFADEDPPGLGHAFHD